MAAGGGTHEGTITGHATLAEAVSFQINCADQPEVDHCCEKLVEGGGEYSQCGWLKDRFGLSWQVIPRAMVDYIGGPDPAGCARAMVAMLKMSKLDIDALRRAYEGTAAQRTRRHAAVGAVPRPVSER